jgi:preprotein translocase subunit SecD
MVCEEEKMKKLGWRIWLLIIILALSFLSIFGFPPTFLEKGVLITSVDSNSVSFQQGLKQGQIITSVDGKTIESLDDYAMILLEKDYSEGNLKTIITTKDSSVVIFSNITPQITVSEIPKTNIKMGLDLMGGSRALIKAQDFELTASDANELSEVIENRLNVYGISDVKVLPISDLSGTHYVRVEIAGATPDDLEKLISEQGKFEAKIGDDVVFVGGKDEGITSVARSGQQAGIESCHQNQEGGYYCSFRFAVYLSEEAAQRHANITSQLEVNKTASGNYLSKKLDFYLDDNFLEDKSLYISEGLKGRVTTQISIQGSGSGETQEDAYKNAEQEMKDLQTILITGSLPYKLEIVKLDTISPTLGSDFIRAILFAGVAALLAVALIIFVKYKKLKSSVALLLISISEIFIILGIAALIEWNLDLPSIAGIIATIGTGIDDLIIILDESVLKGILSLKQRLKRAFAIILGAYFTSLVSLLPLMWAGAGLLKGFAITTIIGITTGVLITRPAFSEIIKKLDN